MATIVLFGNIQINEKTNKIEEGQLQKITDIANRYARNIPINVIIIGKVKDTKYVGNVSVVAERPNIMVNYYHITDTFLYQKMFEHNYPFINFMHRLYGFNIMSFLCNLHHCHKILDAQQHAIYNNYVLFSRIDIFLSHFDKLCSYFMELINDKANPNREGILRHDFGVEDRFFFLKKGSLLLFLSHIKKLITFTSGLDMYSAVRNYPEGFFYDYFKINGMLNDTILKQRTITVDVVVNWTKYSEDHFRDQLQSYLMYIESANEPFMLTTNGMAVPLLEVGRNKKGLCIDNDWITTNFSHCIKFDFLSAVKNIRANNLLFNTKYMKIGIIDYESVNLKILDIPINEKRYMSFLKIRCDIDESYVNKKQLYIEIKQPTNRKSLVRMYDQYLNKYWYSHEQSENNHVITWDINRYTQGEQRIFDLQILCCKEIRYTDISIKASYKDIDMLKQPIQEGTALFLIGFDKFWNVPEQHNMILEMINKLNADVFIITYTNCFPNIENEVKTIKYIERCDILDTKRKTHKLIRKNHHPEITIDPLLGVFMQYYNLNICFQKMADYEITRGKQYKYVFKTRPDICIQNFNWDLDKFIEPNKIYMDSDFMFYGTRHVMEVCCDLIAAKFSFYDKVPWNKRKVYHSTLLQSVQNNTPEIFEQAHWLWKNKIVIFPIQSIPAKFGPLDWDKNPRQYFINVCNYFLNDPVGKTDRTQYEMTSLSTFDREPNMFQCEYFIVDWVIRNNIIVCEPKYFTLLRVMR